MSFRIFSFDFTIEFTVELVSGIPIVTKTITHPDGRTEASSAPVLNIGEYRLDSFSGYQCKVFDCKFLAVFYNSAIYVFYINSLDSEPITSGKILFLRDIMKDLQKTFSKKGRFKVNKLEALKARGGIERSLGLAVTHKKLHEKQATEYKKIIDVKIFPSVYRNWKQKHLPPKYFLISDWVKIEEIPSPLMIAEK